MRHTLCRCSIQAPPLPRPNRSIMRIYLQTLAAQNQPPRFCHLILQEDLLEGWTLVRESGLQGRAGRIKKEYFPDWDQAEHALTAARDDQIRRGYQVVFSQGSPMR